MEPFTEDSAADAVRRYRRRGLDRSTRRLVTMLDVRGGSVLEVGGGVGELHVELLRRGAASTAANVEITPVYERAARELVNELGLAAVVDRVVCDSVADCSRAADVVVVHRVVCCTDDAEGVVSAAAGLTGRTLAITWPRPAWWVKVVGAAVNLGVRVVGWDWRYRVHPDAAIVEPARRAGLAAAAIETGVYWRYGLFGRASADGGLAPADA